MHAQVPSEYGLINLQSMACTHLLIKIIESHKTQAMMTEKNIQHAGKWETQEVTHINFYSYTIGCYAYFETIRWLSNVCVP